MKILEVNIQLKNEAIERIVVLADFTSSNSKPMTDIRVIEADNKVKWGYTMIEPSAELNMSLLTKVANLGNEINNVDNIPPEWRKKYCI